MSGEFFRRLTRLHRLLWIEERIYGLETREERSRDRADKLQRQVDKLQRRVDELQKQIEASRKKGNRTLHLLKRSVDQVDMLKSSLEVPDELIDEFHEWKARNRVPEDPLVTVIVATYNRPLLLTKQCVPSVLNQTYDNLELVVVGDDCTDETKEAIAEIQDQRLRFVNLPERGAYPADPMRRWMVAGTAALNKGLSLVRGDYITHLDDDDEYAPERLEKLTSFAAENGCDFVWHPFWWEYAEGEWGVNEASEFTHSNVTTSSVFYRSWFKKIPWDVRAHLLLEPGDWNRLRKIKYIDPVSMRYPEPLLTHYREKGQIR